MSYDIRSDDCSRYASTRRSVIASASHSESVRVSGRIRVHVWIPPRIATRNWMRTRVRTGIPTPTPNSIWTLTFTPIWTLTRNLDLKLDPDLDSDLDLGSLKLWHIRFAESETEFGWDSVKPSIQCANPNADSLRMQFRHEFISKTGSA